jgi:AcrR family transcriptional regulator
MDSPAQARKASRREQEFQLRRQEILNAARSLFIEKGLRNTTLDEIAEQSAFGKGTIYNYFANKDDLFRDLIHQLIDESCAVTEAAMELAPEGARPQLLAYALAAISYLNANDEAFLMIMREHHQLAPESIEQFRGRFEQKVSQLAAPLAAEIRAGRLRPADPRQLAVLFDGLIRTYWLAANQGLWATEKQPPEAVAELMVSVFFDGIANKTTQG